MDKPETKPLLTVLNFSGGKQSSALLWMVLLDKIERTDNFIVLNADPGMENSETYQYVRMMFDRCREAGIECRTVEGPNLYADLVNLPITDKTRIDNPPYWTKDANGRRGKLMQCCTKHYKIAPMDREIRRILEERFGISRKSSHLGEGIVEKWIGFARDEIMRIKRPPQKYVRFRYPLIEMRMKTDEVLRFFENNNLPVPPRSVCNACFANSVEHFREMFENRPEDWQQAVAVDRAVRDWTQVGVKEEVYVSKSLIPLDELAARGFVADDGEEDDWCQTGYCFT